MGLEGSLRGLRGRVRELWERGERTVLGLMVREAARLPGAAAAFPRAFFATGRDSGAELKAFSWSPSEAISMCEDFRFLALLAGGAIVGRIGEADL